MTVTLYHGDCLTVMPTLEENSVDAIVCDPPYGLSFMGKDWDHGVPGVAFWKEALRVAKPGAHLLAFGGTRTFHRLAVAIEDAGWEIRDTVMWVYGSGFPKSHDVSKAIDKALGAERERIGTHTGSGYTKANVAQGSQERDTWEWAKLSNEAVTPEATRYTGYGTALKPAWEPIIMARKPFDITVAANVLKWGTGAINVDGCRVEVDWANDPSKRGFGYGFINNRADFRGGPADFSPADNSTWKPTQGRWPANLVHDGSDEVTELFPVSDHARGNTTAKRMSGTGFFGRADTIENGNPGDTGSASRFFYCAKASKADRDGSTHPTVKPSSLMRYLCRLVTPPQGMILDPFMGSGSTGKAAVLEGFSFVGIDQKAEYVDDARVRTENAQKQVDAASQQLSFSIELSSP